MTSTTARTYQGKTAEHRAQARRRLLLDTAFALMSSDGWRQVNIENLCREAKLHKRYFYESFPDLDALGAAVVDELAAQLLVIGIDGARAARQAGAETETIARDVMRALVTWLVEDRRRARVLFSEISDNPRAQAHRKSVIRQLANELSDFGHEFHGVNEPQAIARVASALLIGGSIEVLVDWLDGEITMTLDALVEDLAALWVTVGMNAAVIAKRQHERPRR